LQLRTELGDRAGMATSWGVLGDIERNRGNWNAAESLYRQSLQLHEELGDSYKTAVNFSDFALLEKQRGNLTLAQQYYDQAKTIYQQLGAAKDLESIETEWNS
jgi:tetratricopeptide (TPR) repeat protein